MIGTRRPFVIWTDCGVKWGQNATSSPTASSLRLMNTNNELQTTLTLCSPHLLEEFENYDSMDEGEGAAARELARMWEAKYAIDFPGKFWRSLQQGCVHRTALITKVRRAVSLNSA